MEAYHEFIEPSRISHSVGCNFISPTTKHLIIGKASILQIFEVVLLKKSTVTKPQYRLKLIDHFKLHGQITDLKAIRTVENPVLDYLIVSTKWAKFSIIRWDHQLHTISTVSLHYYEEALQNMTYEKLSFSELLVEPSYYSCACLRFKNLLCFLPFETNEVDDDDMDEDDDEHMVEHKNSVNGSGSGGANTGEVVVSSENSKVFDSSFIIDGQSLDSSIDSIVDMQFLYNYREPTIAILSQKNHVWSGNLIKQKDNLQFSILTIDLASRTTVSVLKVENLPYDIDRIISLPSPLNGCLLFGCNEIIHVDNGGIVRRIAVNQFTPLITASTKNYLDQSDLNLKLENCNVVLIPNDHRVLLVLNNGEFYYINFEVDGKSIKSLNIEVIDKILYNSVNLVYPGDITVLDNNLLFFTNQNGDSPLVQFKYKDSSSVSTGNLRIEGGEDDDDDDDDDEQGEGDDGNTVKSEKSNGKPTVNGKEEVEEEDDDDFYNDEEEEQKIVLSKSSIEFLLHDELMNFGVTSSFTLGYYSTEKYIANLKNPNYNEVCIVSNSGTHIQGRLNIITPTVQPNIVSSLTFSQVNRMWNINQKFLITSDDINSKSEIFQIEKSFARLKSKDFINNEATISMHELNNGKYILQITPHKIILYNNSFKKRLELHEGISNDDEIINSTLKDEFLMIFLSSGDVLILAINTYNETFTKVEIPKILSDVIITSGAITNSRLLTAVSKNINLAINKGQKRSRISTLSYQMAPTDIGPKSKTFILVTGDNRIVAFNRFHNQKCFQLNDVDKFTDTLTLAFFDPKQIYPDPFIKQVILGELGDKDHKEEYLTILTIGGEVIMYKLFYDGENYRFRKEKNSALTGAPDNAYPLGTAIERRLVHFSNRNGFKYIFVTGVTPYIILKSLHSIPRIFKFSKIPILSISSYADSKVTNGLIYLDNHQNARICELASDFSYENTWPIKTVHVGESIKSIAYHETSNTYIVSTISEIPYEGIDEEGKPIVGIHNDLPRPESFKGSIKLISPYNWTVIDSIEFKDDEVGMSVKSMVLDVGNSKRFKNKRELITVGTGKYRIEDLSSNGAFKIYEIIDIVPEPGKPETNHKFKEMFQEDTRGAVTSICEVSGRFLAAQGQKIIVRELEEDSVVPVAFLDTSVYVTEAKSFGNLVILGDSIRSIWLIGFDAEPFRVIMLGKDLSNVDVNCADFITKDEEIYVLLADNNNILHLVQYDPEDPSSLNGQRLISRASFALTSYVTCMKKIPRSEESYDADTGIHEFTTSNDFQTIGSTIDGSFFTVFPISEATYRRMYILQQQLIDKEYHYCGLNPRLNRYGGLSLIGNDTNTKPILDYDVIKTFAKLNEDRKKNLSSKVSSKNISQDIWKDIIEFEHVLQGL